MSTDLTVKERLEAEEEIIESNMDSFFAVGEALGRIKNAKLYLVTHATWEQYVERRWRKSRRWSQLKILDVKIDKECENFAQTPPKLTSSKPVLRTRAHKKALQAAPSEQRKAILDTAVEKHGEKITAAQLEAEVRRSAKKAAERDPIPETGEITKHVQEALDSRPKFEELRRSVAALHKQIENLSVEDCGAFLLQEMSQVSAQCQTLKDILKFTAPYSDCVLCTQAGCKVCRNTGWVPKLTYDRFPDDSKKRSFVHK